VSDDRDENRAVAAEPERGAKERPRDLAAEFRLRPERPAVMRLSRRALAVLGGVSALALGGAFVWGLQSGKPKTPTEELYNTDRKSPAEGLARLPGDYRGLPRTVPQLGPPLPGDLGRPMLQAGAQPPPIGTPPSGQPDPEAQRRDQARQRVAQERDAARTSRLFASGTRSDAAPSPVAGATPAPPLSQVTPVPAASPPAPDDRKSAFLNGSVDRRTASLDALEPPASPYVLQAGGVIAAAMVTGLRSDLPGQIVAQVTENVYDGPTGRFLLIPQGSRLVGQYDARVTFGQRRALLVWNRLILPNGHSIVLERQPGADPKGYAGLQDRVDNHWSQLFRAAILTTLMSVGSEAGTSSDENDLLRAIRRGGSESISQAGRQIVGRSLDIQPTLTVRPGFPVRVIVTRDLILERYRG
jgi:type IV secretion system protein VirB10